jgi:hypothetical protein
LEGPREWVDGRGRRRRRRGRKGEGDGERGEGEDGEGKGGEVGGEVDQLPAVPLAEEVERVTAAAAAAVVELPPTAVVPGPVDKEAGPEREHPGRHRSIFGDPRGRNSTRTSR